MASNLNDVTGYRGEKIVELCLTDYRDFSEPLFRPGFLGDKWPAIDFYVELNSIPQKRLYFFVQAKSTTSPIGTKSKHLQVSATRNDIDRLLQVPGPTYLLGVHEPSRRVFVRSVHHGTPVKAIGKISIAHELTSTNLKKLYNEVRSFWESGDHKPVFSEFS